MYRKQRGITLIGWLFLLVPVAIVGYAIIRITPVYLNYMKVARTLEQIADEYRGQQGITPQQLRSSLEKRLDIESVTFPTPKDIQVRRDGQAWVMEAKYEDVAPLFANVSVLLAFDKTVQIK